MSFGRASGSDQDFGACGGASGDESGTLALIVDEAHDSVVSFVSPSGKLIKEQVTSLFGSPLQQPRGFATLSGRPYLGPVWGILHGQEISIADSSGASTGVAVLGAFTPNANLAGAADPRGGVLRAGDLSLGPFDDAGNSLVPIQHAAIMYEGGASAGAIRFGPVPLASAGAVVGVGVDLLGRSLVITDAAKQFGPGAISAQWLDADGTPLTGEFLLLQHFTPGPSTWFETTALAAGGVVVRRMDATKFQDRFGVEVRLEAQALVVVDSGTELVRAAPDWMTSRPNTRLELTPSASAYVALPYGATGVSCSQRVEIFALDGTSCGTTDYAMAAGTCDTTDLVMTADGTIVQRLPASMESLDPDSFLHTCTWQWWPKAVR
jgi:hypothetical protein